MDNTKIKKIVNSNIWFLIGGFLFLIESVRAYMLEDATGTIRYFIAFVIFLAGFALQVIYSEKRKDEKSMKLQ